MTDPALRPALSSLRARIRALYLLHGTGRTAAVLAALLALSFLLDVVLRPPLPVRAVHGVLSLAAFAFALRAFLVGPLRRTAADLTDEELALAVEARVPSLQDRLVSALQWERLRADPDSGESRAFMDAAAAEAAAAVGAVRAGDLTDARPARRAAALGGIAAAAFAVVAVASGETALLWARRSLLLQDEPWPRRTTLHVVGFEPGNPRIVTVGDDLPVQVRVEGEVPEEGVLLHYLTLPPEGARADRDTRPMLQSDEDPLAFAFVFHEVTGSFRFWVTGGDDDDGEPRYEVTALVPPAIEEVVADLVFPAATGRPPERRAEADLEVPAGTTARISVRASLPLRTLHLVHPAPAAAPAPLALSPDGRAAVFEVVIRESADWRLDMVGADGARSVPARNTRRFTALPDPRPDVRLLAPSSRQFAVADGRVPVKVRATDNYSLQKVALEVVPGRGREPQEIPLWTPPAAGADGKRAPSLAVGAYRLLDLASLSPPDGARGVPLEDEILLRGVAADNGGSTSSTDQVAVQVTDPSEMLRRLTQRQTRVREDLESLRRRLEEARLGAVKARDAIAAGALEPTDRVALRTPATLAGRAAREASSLADSLGEVLLTYALNRLVENRVASDRVVAQTDAWLREDDGPPTPVFKPALWRRLAAAHEAREIDDSGILGSLLAATGLSDRLGTGPAAVLRDRLDSLAAGAADPPAAAAEAVKSADESLALVREIALHLREWETLHEILEATRSLLDWQGAIEKGLRGAPPAPEGK